jgi:hypothetical protein
MELRPTSFGLLRADFVVGTANCEFNNLSLMQQSLQVQSEILNKLEIFSHIICVNIKRNLNEKLILTR